ncbi:Hypothetical_protein [Hexamita inflata]|uniref:Hypothetical_protein n=1 Tax=Hexamita inflata TaxID=28002 RepID=A0ABP1GXB0_9EUKA
MKSQHLKVFQLKFVQTCKFTVDYTKFLYCCARLLLKQALNVFNIIQLQFSYRCKILALQYLLTIFQIERLQVFELQIFEVFNLRVFKLQFCYVFICELWKLIGILNNKLSHIHRFQETEVTRTKILIDKFKLTVDEIKFQKLLYITISLPRFRYSIWLNKTKLFIEYTFLIQTIVYL